MKPNIVFIGGGNMASSLIGGLIANQYPADRITVAEPDSEKLAQLATQYKIQTTTDNILAAQQNDIIVLAVKPQILQQVCQPLGDSVKTNQPLIISIAAGIRSTDIDRWLGGSCAVVRCMPNTPSLIQQGATGLYANSKVSKEQQQMADEILSAAGITLWVDDEVMLDTVTAVSGSGPAYFFLFMEAMQKAGQQLGLDENSARRLTLQTALGAARMAIESEDSPEILRTKVTSKGGTTEAAINNFISNDFEGLVASSLTAARDRANELAELLGKDK